VPRAQESAAPEPTLNIAILPRAQEFYGITLEALAEAKNDRLWFKTQLKLCSLWLRLREYSRATKLLKELHRRAGQPALRSLAAAQRRPPSRAPERLPPAPAASDRVTARDCAVEARRGRARAGPARTRTAATTLTRARSWWRCMPWRSRRAG